MKSVCFTGHRHICNEEQLQNRLIETLESLISNGVTDFYAGGAIGFDTLAANVVLLLREKYSHIKLHLILPCCKFDQTAKWTTEQIAEYDRILSAADSAEYICEKYYYGCMKARNARLVELADCCVCYYDNKNSASGTGQTVRMAERKGITVFNTFEKETHL